MDAQLTFPEFGKKSVSVQHYNNYTPKDDRMQLIFYASRSEENPEFFGDVKRHLLADKNKTLLFISSKLSDPRQHSVDFIKARDIFKVLKAALTL